MSLETFSLNQRVSLRSTAALIALVAAIVPLSVGLYYAVHEWPRGWLSTIVYGALVMILPFNIPWAAQIVSVGARSISVSKWFGYGGTLVIGRDEIELISRKYRINGELQRIKIRSKSSAIIELNRFQSDFSLAASILESSYQDVPWTEEFRWGI